MTLPLQPIIDSDTKLRRQVPQQQPRAVMAPALLGTILATLFVAALLLGYLFAQMTS